LATLATDLGPLLPAPSLTGDAGNLNSDYTITGSLTTFMTTVSLAIGTWLITMGATVVLTGVDNTEIEAVAGTATATLTGRTSVEVDTSDADATVSFKAVVTVAGNIAFQARGAGTGTLTIKATTPTSGYARATGYTALKIA
jgi:phage gp45-like